VPANLVHVEAHQRHAGVAGEGQPEGIGCQADDPQMLRQIVQDDHDRRWDEDTEQKAANEVESQQQLVVAGEGNDQRRGDIKQARPDHYAAQAEDHGKPGDGGGDEDLRRGGSRCQPCPLVEAQAELSGPAGPARTAARRSSR